MREPEFWDRENRPLDLLSWAFLRSRGEPYVRVALTNLGDEFVVSTIWTGLDSLWLGNGPPLIFETAVFDHGDVNVVDRYPDLRSAQAGHDNTVTFLMEVRSIE